VDEFDGFDFELWRINGDRACHRDTSLGSPQSSGVHQSGSTPVSLLWERLPGSSLVSLHAVKHVHHICQSKARIPVY